MFIEKISSQTVQETATQKRQRLPLDDQKRMVENLANKLGFTRQEDYYKLETAHFRKHGLRHLLLDYNDSVLRLITSVFPNYVWYEWLFTYKQNLWSDKAIQKKYMDWLGSKLGITSEDGWYNVTAKEFYQHRGKKLLQAHNYSISSILLNIYPQHTWNLWQLPGGVNPSFWQGDANRRRYLEWLGKKLGYVAPDNWYSVLKRDFTDNHGTHLLALYDGKPDMVVMETFNNHAWDQFQFKVNSPSYFTNKQNIIQVLDKVAKKANFQVAEEWYSATRNDFAHVPYGWKLYKEFNGDILKLVQFRYPDYQWDKQQFGRNAKKKGQKVLEKLTGELFKGYKMIPDARKETQLRFANGRYMELDVFFPELNLGFEYQDPHHYHDQWFGNIAVSEYKKRDNDKLQAAAAAGISLVIVPYWWDNKYESLIGSIKFIRPELLPHLSGIPIPDQIPEQYKDSPMKDYFVPGIGVPMLPCSIKTFKDFDAKDWWVMEKYDGIRALYSPETRLFVSRSGKTLWVPDDILRQFKNIDFWIDGEIWFGHGRFDEAGKVAHRAADIDWGSFKFIAFDAPKYTGLYRERYNHLVTNLSNPYTIVPPFQKIASVEDILQIAQNVINSKGEGIILRHPNSLYTNGRSQFFLKMKKYRDFEAQIISNEGDSWKCQLPNGVYFVAPVESSLKNTSKLQPGAIVSFKYRGYRKDGIPKAAVIYKVRSDISWDDLKVNKTKSISYKDYAPHLFPCSNRKPLGFWGEKNNVREWFNQLASARGLNPMQPETWQAISLSDMKIVEGSASLRTRYGSLKKALKFAYST